MAAAVTPPSHLVAAGRIGWTVISFVAVQAVVCGLAMLPAVALWQWLMSMMPDAAVARTVAVGLLIMPLYMTFVLDMMWISPLAVRLCGWRAPSNVEVALASLDWTLLRWARYAAAVHVVRVIAGTWFRGTPLWTAHMRLFGARLGKRVYVNSVHLADYNLLEFGNDVVIGASVHLSGHTVESGMLKTAPIRLGNRVTIGLSSIVEIGAQIGDGAQVGALSFVPKFATLAPNVTYVGAPVAPLTD